MDFEYGEQAESFRAELRSWLEANLDPDWRRHVDAVESEASEDLLTNAWMKEWSRKLYEAGFKGIHWPAEYGGRGLSLLEQIVFAEEMFRADAPPVGNFLAETLVGPTIIHWGTDEQKKRFLEPILSGDELWCQGFSEPDAGSDLAGLQTRAVLDGDEWVITGQKVWTTLGHIADHCFLLARTDPDAPRHKGISYLLVPMKQDGVTVRPLTQMSRIAEFNEVFFDEARCPAGNVVGGVNNGWKVAMTTLGFERGSSVTTQALRFRRELDGFIDTAKERIGSDGRPKSEDPIVRQQLARAYTMVHIMKAQAYRSLTALIETGDPGPGGSINKIFWSEYHRWVTEVGMSLRGLEGQLVGPDYGLDAGQVSYLFAKSETIWGGTAEIQRNIVGERILGLPREPKVG
ncbi:MAG: acyl-CoA dehydrogenase [Actinobacteria bacterium ATB1]|nr:acyl-CoA dehydrogenase [Actinobacteria bacterium ATB1]